MKRITEKISLFLPFILIVLFLLLFIYIVRTSLFERIEKDKYLFFEISFLLLLALVAEIGVVYFKQPSVILLLLLGIILSESFLETVWPFILQSFPVFPATIPKFVADENLIHIFSQVGAIFILLRIGLHVKFGEIFNLENGIVAFLGVVIPFVCGYFYAVFTGGDMLYGMFLGTALTATSVGITAALLKQFELLETKVAQVILGAAVIDDILGLTMLSFVSILSVNSGAIEFSMLLPMILSLIVFLVGGAIVGKLFVTNFIDKTAFDSKTLLLVFCFVFSYAHVAEYIGLSSIIGAFLAGIILNKSIHRTQVDERTSGLELIFAPMFFISIGMLINVHALMMFFVPIIVITVLAFISKIIGCGIGACLIKLRPIESLLVGIGMSPRGEVALIIGLLGLSKGILNSEQYSIIAAMAFLTTFFIPIMMHPLLKRIENDQRNTNTSKR